MAHLAQDFCFMGAKLIVHIGPDKKIAGAFIEAGFRPKMFDAVVIPIQSLNVDPATIPLTPEQIDAIADAVVNQGVKQLNAQAPPTPVSLA